MSPKAEAKGEVWGGREPPPAFPIHTYVAVPTVVGGNILGVFLAVTRVVGENILGVFLAVPRVVGENMLGVFF